MRHKAAAKNGITLCIQAHINTFCCAEDAVSIMIGRRPWHETPHSFRSQHRRTQHTNKPAITHGKHLHVVIRRQLEGGDIVLHARNYYKKSCFCQGLFFFALAYAVVFRVQYII